MGPRPICPPLLICIFSSLPNKRPFGSSLASGSIGTLNSRKNNLMMNDPLRSSRVSSQKQNREGVVRAQSGQYCATAERSLGCVVETVVEVHLRSIEFISAPHVCNKATHLVVFFVT
ncbi:hypothetical protein DVH24_003994 [Malus domestica]|uniref:Uncharacterized protein n=1 Tax=Malus domestica TaxID=3750 RepID=A0A498KCY5_MALDO|nr:hypothetical protein DVH24_003994 [Malus domestica]